MLKENASREERYQNMIDRLSSNIENGIENIQNRLDAMENDMQVDKKRRLESLLFLYLKSKKKGNQYGKNMKSDRMIFCGAVLRWKVSSCPAKK